MFPQGSKSQGMASASLKIWQNNIQYEFHSSLMKILDVQDILNINTSTVSNKATIQYLPEYRFTHHKLSKAMSVSA